MRAYVYFGRQIASAPSNVHYGKQKRVEFAPGTHELGCHVAKPWIDHHFHISSTHSLAGYKSRVASRVSRERLIFLDHFNVV